MALHGLQEVMRAGRGKPATGGWPCRKFEHRTQDPLVKSDHHADQKSEESPDHDFS